MLGREQHAGPNGALVGLLQVSWVAGDGVASEVLAEGRVPESEVAGGAAGEQADVAGSAAHEHVHGVVAAFGGEQMDLGGVTAVSAAGEGP